MKWFRPCTFPSHPSGPLWCDAVPLWCNTWTSTQLPRYGLSSEGEAKVFLHLGLATTTLFFRAKVSLEFCFAKQPQLAVDTSSQRKPLSLFLSTWCWLAFSSPPRFWKGFLFFAFPDPSKGLLMSVKFHLVRLIFSILAFSTLTSLSHLHPIKTSYISLSNGINFLMMSFIENIAKKFK